MKITTKNTSTPLFIDNLPYALWRQFYDAGDVNLFSPLHKERQHLGTPSSREIDRRRHPEVTGIVLLQLLEHGFR